MEQRYFIKYGGTVCLDQSEDCDARSKVIETFFLKTDGSGCRCFMVYFYGETIEIIDNWDVSEFLFSKLDNLGDSTSLFLFMCRDSDYLTREELHSKISFINFYLEEDIRLASKYTKCDVIFRDNDSQGLLILRDA